MSEIVSHLMPYLTRVLGNGKKKREQPKRKTEPAGAHIHFDEEEELAIIAQIERDMASADGANKIRRLRAAQYQKLWRDEEGMPGGENGESNLAVPLIPSQVREKLAKEFQAIFGEDATIIAEPTKPTDVERLAKVGAFMKWQVFSAMKDFVDRWMVFQWRRLMFGRALAELTYKRHYYNHPKKGRVCWMESPDLVPWDQADVFTPGEEVTSVQQFSFVIYRYYATPEQLLSEEEDSEHYYGIEDDWEEIIRLSKLSNQRDDIYGEGQTQAKNAQDDAEGVKKKGTGFVEVWAWYGRWRMLEEQEQDRKSHSKRMAAERSRNDPPENGRNADKKTSEEKAEDEDKPGFTAKPIPSDRKREKHQTDLIIRYIPRLRGHQKGAIKAAQKLDELFPDTPFKRPIVELAMERDGSFWCAGVPELLLGLHKEATVTENLFTQGGQYTITPIGFYKPASGANPDILRYEPGILIPSENPGDIQFVTITLNPTYFQLKQQSTMSWVERLMGTSDFSAGRNIQRANAPKTARATIALLEQGNLRVSLDTGFLLLDFGVILKRIWQLCVMFAPEEQFFRVTGEDAEGLFETDRGFAKMTHEEFSGEFDFTLKPATGPHAKEALKDDLLQFFSIAMQHPIFQTNPYAAYMLLKMVGKKFGVDITKIIPQPQKPELSEDPKDEWLKMLQGRFSEVTISPADDDHAHLLRHYSDADKHNALPKEDQKQEALDFLIDHIQKHEEQAQQKAAAQAAMQVLMKGIQAQMAATGNRFGEQDQAEQQSAGGIPIGPPQQPSNTGLDVHGGAFTPGAGMAQ